jgi:two-component system, cell cycle response regulator
VAYLVGLFGFTDHRAGLLRLVLSGTHAPVYDIVAGNVNAASSIDIAVIDVFGDVPDPMLAQVRKSNPTAPFVFVSEHGLSGDSRFRLERRSLLAQIRRMLDKVVREEFLSEKVTALSVVKQFGSVARIADSFPLDRNKKAICDGQWQVAPPATNAPLLALLVDDSATVRAQLRAGLEQIGLRCHEAEDAERAMSLIERNWYDLAFFDVVMPGVDGYELCRRLKHDARTRRLPILLLTSRSSPFDRARGALVGCDTYLTKPISWEKFRQAVDEALRKAFQSNPGVLRVRGYGGEQRR